MRIRDIIKKYLPSYRTEKRLVEKFEKIEKDMREMDTKNEFLFWMSQMRDGETMQETKERVFLRMPKATGRLRDIQMAENYILRRVKDICDENGLSMFLMGGTLLGAIRHKGFIPWDNDIDVGMMKSDYLKLRELLNQDEELISEYYYNYEAGLRISKVKFRESDVFWIDIFVFDYLDAQEENVNEKWRETQAANGEFSKTIREAGAPYQKDYTCRPLANAKLDDVTEKCVEELSKELGCIGCGKYFCETIDSPYWSRDPRSFNLVEDSFPLLKNEVEFEGNTYDVWKNYQQGLRVFFGDIWKLPFSVTEAHSGELDEGFTEAMEYIRKKGIIE